MRLLQRETGLSPPAAPPSTPAGSNLLLTVSKAMLLLWLILIVNVVRPLSVCLDLLFNLFRTALWPSVGKELPLGFSLVLFLF